MISKSLPLNRDYHRDAKHKNLKRSGLLIKGLHYPFLFAPGPVRSSAWAARLGKSGGRGR